MNPWMAVLAALIGYLFGSISSARLVTGRVAPGTNINRVEEPVPNSDQMFVMESVSATNVRVKVGTRYGCLTAILDMLKVALPTLVLRLLFPDQPYYLIAAAMGVLGHDYPIYYRFKGGRGESATYGGLLAIDLLGVVVTNIGAVILGWLTGQLLVFRWGALILLIPWMWFTTHDPWHLAYILFVNLVYWTSLRPELSQFFAVLKSGPNPTQEDIDQFLGMGGKLGRFMDRYSLPGLIGRLRKKST